MQSDGFRDLVRRAQARDRQAMDQLLAAVRPALQHHARPYATLDQPEASASDLVQSACLHAWQKLAQFACGADDAQTLAQFRAWMIRILHRLGLNAVRSRSAQCRQPPGICFLLGLSRPAEGADREDRAEPIAPDATPSSQARTGERTRLLHQALANVPADTDRAIVRLRFFEGQSLRQIAAHLQLSEDKVRERFHFTLRRLERELGGLL